MNKYNSKAIFHLPGVFIFSKFYQEFLKLYTEHRFVFMDNIEIGSIYGAPYPCIWNGGRYMDNLAHKPVMDIIKDMMQTLNIPVRLTLTNCLIEEKHLNDTYSNILVSTFHTGYNEIICNSELLENYLRETYPNYKYLSSTTKRLLDINTLNEECEKDYKLVVLDYSKNKDFDFLKQIKHPEKIELLCNAVCQPNCARRAEHYKAISRATLMHDPGHLFQCQYCDMPFGGAMKHPHFISKENINDYLALGIQNFKLEGRTTHILDLIDILVYYLIKPEFQEEVRFNLQRIFF